MTTPDGPDAYDVCECGDYRREHAPNDGRCLICSYGRATVYGAVCRKFRPFKSHNVGSQSA